MKMDKRFKKMLSQMCAEGGKAAAARMTPEQRRERARKAGIASGKARAKKSAES